MIKLGIFGDSWTDPESGHHEYPELSMLSWMNILNKHYDVTTFGKSASGVYYSYRKFIDNHDKFDKIIFLGTAGTRWIKGFQINGQEEHLNNIAAVEHFLNDQHFSKNLLQHDKKELLALRDYYEYLVDIEYSDTMKQLMIESVKKIRPDTVVMDMSNTPIKEYIILQAKTFNKPHPMLYGEKRCICHMTPELNQAFAQTVLNMLNTGDWGDIPEHVEVPHNIDYYYYYAEGIINQR